MNRAEVIKNCSIEDIPAILDLYEMARGYQKMMGATPWPLFDNTIIECAIKENRQWKICVDESVACVWTTTFNDPQIWSHRNADPAVYIHRIATHTQYRGLGFVSQIVKWATIYAASNGKKFIRMDTVGENKKLINYYYKCGFNFLGLSRLTDTTGLPDHYHNATVSLFEITL